MKHVAFSISFYDDNFLIFFDNPIVVNKACQKEKGSTYRHFGAWYVEDLFPFGYYMSMRGPDPEALSFHPKSEFGIFGTCLFISFENLENPIVFPTRYSFGLGTVTISLECPGLERLVHITFGAVPGP